MRFSLIGVAKAYARRLGRGEIAFNEVPASIKEQVEILIGAVPEGTEAGDSEPEAENMEEK